MRGQPTIEEPNEATGGLQNGVPRTANASHRSVGHFPHGGRACGRTSHCGTASRCSSAIASYSLL